MSDLISHTEIVDAHCLKVSRHRPVDCRLLIPDSHIDTLDTINVDTNNLINWRRALDHHITQFNHELTSDQDMTYIATSKLTQPEIDRSYSTLTDRILSHDNACLPQKRYKRHLKPYWNEELKSLHQEMNSYVPYGVGKVALVNMIYTLMPTVIIRQQRHGSDDCIGNMLQNKCHN